MAGRDAGETFRRSDQKPLLSQGIRLLTQAGVEAPRDDAGP